MYAVASVSLMQHVPTISSATSSRSSPVPNTGTAISGSSATGSSTPEYSPTSCRHSPACSASSAAACSQRRTSASATPTARSRGAIAAKP